MQRWIRARGTSFYSDTNFFENYGRELDERCRSTFVSDGALYRLYIGSTSALYRLYIGSADGMSIARVWKCRYSK